MLLRVRAVRLSLEAARTLLRSRFRRDCWGAALAVRWVTDDFLWSNRAALAPRRAARPWLGCTSEPVCVSLDWKSCCNRTLSLAAGGEEEEEEKKKCGRKVRVKRSKRHWWKQGGVCAHVVCAANEEEVGRVEDVNKEGAEEEER